MPTDFSKLREVTATYQTFDDGTPTYWEKAGMGTMVNMERIMAYEAFRDVATPRLVADLLRENDRLQTALQYIAQSTARNFVNGEDECIAFMQGHARTALNPAGENA